MTDIVIVPAAPVVPPFPALGAPDFNQAAYTFGVAMPAVSAGVKALADTTNTNATAAKEQALAAQTSRVQAGIEVAAIKSAAITETTAIKNDAVSETTAIKNDAVADTAAIKSAAVIELTAIKAAAVSETAAISESAAGSAAAAADSAAAAQAVANFVGRWDELSGPLPNGSTAYHAGKFWVSLEAVANVALSEPGVSSAWAKASSGIDRIAYDSRGGLRARAGADGDLVLIDGLGLFSLSAGSDEPDDDESCFATAAGRWLLQAAHWDVIDAWQLPEVEERDAYDEDENLRFDSSFANSFPSSFAAAFASSFPASFSGKVLAGTAACAITSVAATTSASFTGTVTGAVVGNRVIATPPAELGATSAETGRLGYHAWVSAANVVTVSLTNASAATANTNAAIRAAWPITVIKS